MIGATGGQATVVVGVPALRLYEMVSDITRMGEWSPECRGGQWLNGSDGVAVGAEFRGDNRLGPRRWSTTSRVTSADPGREFAFSVIVRGREATRWRYRFEPRGTETAVTESFEYLWAPWYFAVGNVVLRRGWQLRRAIRSTLGQLKAAAESSDALPPSDPNGGSESPAQSTIGSHLVTHEGVLESAATPTDYMCPPAGSGTRPSDARERPTLLRACMTPHRIACLRSRE